LASHGAGGIKVVRVREGDSPGHPTLIPVLPQVFAQEVCACEGGEGGGRGRGEREGGEGGGRGRGEREGG
jgi:hypothetical protein